jgi:hypothetical protein
MGCREIRGNALGPYVAQGQWAMYTLRSRLADGLITGNAGIAAIAVAGG